MGMYEKCNFRIEKWLCKRRELQIVKDFENIEYIKFKYNNYATFSSFEIRYYFPMKKIIITGGKFLEKTTCKELVITSQLKKEIMCAHRQVRGLISANNRCVRIIDGYHWSVKIKAIGGNVVRYYGYEDKKNLWHQLNWRLINI